MGDNEPMKCAECDCDNPPHGCNWIKAGPSLADALELPEIKALIEAANGIHGFGINADAHTRLVAALAALQNNKKE
jgi:hypothetical protein